MVTCGLIRVRCSLVLRLIISRLILRLVLLYFIRSHSRMRGIFAQMHVRRSSRRRCAQLLIPLPLPASSSPAHAEYAKTNTKKQKCTSNASSNDDPFLDFIPSGLVSAARGCVGALEDLLTTCGVYAAEAD